MATAAPLPTSRDFPVRKKRFHFANDIPRHWAGAAVRTHFHNAFTLVFPEGERALIRSVRAAMDRIHDPDLARQADAFVRQEAQHAMEHRRFFDVLRAQGYIYEPFVAQLAARFRRLEQRSPQLMLAAGAAAEHYTSVFAARVLRAGLLSDLPEPMRELFEWHAAEEIEHRSVVFDVFQAVDGSYARRVAGLLLATRMVLGSLRAATRMLLAQDDVPRRTVWRETRELFVKSGMLGAMSGGFASYLRPGFHPSHDGSDALADAVFERYAS